MDGIRSIAYLIVSIYGWMIVARALLSWLHLRPGSFASRIYDGLFRLTEPYLALFRHLLPARRVAEAASIGACRLALS